MRFLHPDGSTVHLAYCTNVHPAEDLPGIVAQLAAHAEPVRRRLGAARLGAGLWLSADAARELAADPEATARLRRELAARGLETVTLNGFPYRGFQQPVVKHAVYAPDWSRPERLHHTLRLARVLAGLLPEDAARGSVSTLPFAWRDPWPEDRRSAALRNLRALDAGLARIEAETGRYIRVGFEPEPGCVAETTGQALAELSGVGPERLGLCLDTCHLAVAHEEPGAAVTGIAATGRPVVKVQASAALQADDPADPRVRAALEPFAEPRFLHQTREPAADGGLHGTDDLAPALRGPHRLPGRAPWRIHYHVPLHAEPQPPLRSTRPVLRRALGALLGGPRALTDHIEAETYTWGVLPEERRPGPEGPAEGIAAELDWLRRELTGLGLREEGGTT